MLWFSLEKGSDAFNKNNVMVTVETFVPTGGRGGAVGYWNCCFSHYQFSSSEGSVFVNSLTHFNPYYYCYISFHGCR